jgi:hypothetical protein
MQKQGGFIGILLVIVAALAIGGFFFYKHFSQPTVSTSPVQVTTPASLAPQSTTTVSSPSVVTNSPTATAPTTANSIPVSASTGASITAPTPSNATVTSSTSIAADSSNAALLQDMSSIDSQMNGLSSDSANADQGLNNPNQ